MFGVRVWHDEPTSTPSNDAVWDGMKVAIRTRMARQN
jgi:hypothetical protein